MSGEIWVDLSCNLTHSGTYDFKGAMLKTIERGIKSGDDENKNSVAKPVSLEDKLKNLLQNPQIKEESKDGKKEVSIEEKLKALLNRDGSGGSKLNKVQIV